MRLSKTAHTSRPWRIHEIAPDFRLEDVWALPGRGGPDDLPRLIEMIASLDPSKASSSVARMLWAIRWKLGELLGWDDPLSGLGSRVPTLRDRLPADVREGTVPKFDPLPFSSLYVTDDKVAAEVANETMHGVMHIGPDGRPSEAQRAVRHRLHGRNQAVLPPDRLPGADATGRELWERAGAPPPARAQ